MSDPSAPQLVPTLEDLRSNSLTKIVQFEIERMILSGELAPGAKLKEKALATKLSVSRGPVREACRALAELGFVYLIPNRGVFVKRLDRREAMEVYDLRAGLTALAGFLIAQMVSNDTLTELQGLIAQMDQATEAADYAAFYPLNVKFHDTIVEATDNDRLIKNYRGLSKEFHLFRSHGTMQKQALLAANVEHRAIIEALRTRNSNAVFEESFKHVANGKQRMLSALDGLAPSDTLVAS